MNPEFTKMAGIAVAALIIGGIVGVTVTSKPSIQPATQDTASTMSNTSVTDDHTSPEWKIENAMSAAPESIAIDATVLDWPAAEGKDFGNLKKGTNGWTCLPDDPGTPGNDPLCGDAKTMEWFGAYMSKKKPNITAPGLAYMLQGGTSASNKDPFAKEPAAGEDWMKALPHVMIFPTTPPDPKIYGTDPEAGGPWVMWANTPYAHLMMPIK